jgi:hypothetical protein
MHKLGLTLIALATLAASLGLATAASAEIYYPWCARYGGDMGGASNCGFSTYEQCMATVSGVGGFCEKNLFYTDAVEHPAKRARKRQSNG